MSNGNGSGLFTDFVTENIDSATLGDVPQTDANVFGDTGSVIPDYGGVGSNWPNLTIPGGLTAASQTSWTGGAVMTPTSGILPALGRGVAAVSPIVFNAIVKLSQRLGGAGTSVLGYGRRVWSQLSSWAAKNPGVSLVSMLVSLGLTVEEAAHFVSWGVTHRRRRRARGISGADLKRTGRTIRKLQRYNMMLRSFCGGGGGGYRRRQTFRRARAR